MQEIKYRQWIPMIKEFHFWGFLNETSFVGPACSETVPMAKKNSQQFTGLYDKNLNEIYEGDIVLCGDNGENFPQEYDPLTEEYVNTLKAVIVGPNKDYPAFEIFPNPCDDVNGLSQLMATGEIEVIGNVHENPEMLKSKGEAV